MDEITKELPSLITQLLPGFLTAWVVYGLTTYTKPPQFERIIQALIYSFIVSSVVAMIELTASICGKFFILGEWDKRSEMIYSTLVAISLGLLLSYFMRSDTFFAFARRLKLTSRTPFPSEWYGAFACLPCYVVLHISGDRRISGFPAEWPTEPTAGHFRLTNAAWIIDNNTEQPLDGNESILIDAKQVEMVEFLKSVKETSNAAENT